MGLHNYKDDARARTVPLVAAENVRITNQFLTAEFHCTHCSRKHTLSERAPFGFSMLKIRCETNFRNSLLVVMPEYVN
jgi:hypothetical protein